MLRFISLSFCCLFSISLMGNTLCLKEKLCNAEPGSYIVTIQDKTFTFFHIYDLLQDKLIIEEVTLPTARAPKRGIHWKSWFENSAPGHTSWTMTQINLEKGTLEESFSFTRQGWFDTTEANQFMGTLLSLSFHEVPFEQRRRVGLAPGHNRPDRRPLWHPPLVVDGGRISNANFEVFKARWPRDRTELSRRYIEVYLPDGATGAPTFFPFWLEVEGKLGNAKLRVIDSGKGAQSPKPPLPYRSPTFVGAGALDTTGLTLKLKSPPYYREFTLMAEEVHSFMGKTFLLPYELSESSENLLTLHVAKEELEKQMLPGEHYRFMITPKGHASAYAETENILKYHSL